jgi:hypothetical protein
MPSANKPANRFAANTDHNETSHDISFDCASSRNGRMLLIANELSARDLNTLMGAMALSLPNCPELDIVCTRQQQEDISDAMNMNGIPNIWVNFVFAEPESYLHVNAQGYQAYVCVIPESNHTGALRALERLHRVMRLGAPVIATRTKDTEKLVNDSCGYLIDRDGAGAMSKAFADLQSKSAIEIWEMSLEAIFSASGQETHEAEVICFASLRKAVA